MRGWYVVERWMDGIVGMECGDVGDGGVSWLVWGGGEWVLGGPLSGGWWRGWFGGVGRMRIGGGLGFRDEYVGFWGVGMGWGGLRVGM